MTHIDYGLALEKEEVKKGKVEIFKNMWGVERITLQPKTAKSTGPCSHAALPLFMLYFTSMFSNGFF